MWFGDTPVWGFQAGPTIPASHDRCVETPKTPPSAAPVAAEGPLHLSSTRPKQFTFGVLDYHRAGVGVPSGLHWACVSVGEETDCLRSPPVYLVLQ